MLIRWFIALALCSLVALAGCRRHDIRTVTIQVPNMKTGEDARKIQDAFIHQTSVKTVRPDLTAGVVRVTYDSMLIAIKNIEFTIADQGFDANDIPADRQASIPNTD